MRIYWGFALTAAALAFLFAGAGVAPSAPPPPSPAFFTIAAINDMHVDTSGTPSTDSNTKAWHNVKNWLVANQSAWNIQGLLVDGDFGNQAGPLSGCAGFAPGDLFSDWQDLQDGLSSVSAAGIKVVGTPGNHDQETSSVDGCGEQRWNNYMSSFLAGLSLSHSDTHWSYAFPLHNSQHYSRIDAVTASGTAQLGIATARFYADATNIADIRGWIDADTNRQFIIGTHMFVGVNNDVCDHTSATDFCTEADGTGNRNDPATMWAGLKDNPRIIGVTSGHTHGAALGGIHDTTTTNTAGATVWAVSDTNTSDIGGYATNTGLGRSNVILMKFLPASNQVEIHYWVTDCECNRTDWNSGSPKVYSWTPMFAPSSTRRFPLPSPRQ